MPKWEKVAEIQKLFGEEPKLKPSHCKNCNKILTTTKRHFCSNECSENYRRTQRDQEFYDESISKIYSLDMKSWTWRLKKQEVNVKSSSKLANNQEGKN